MDTTDDFDASAVSPLTSSLNEEERLLLAGKELTASHEAWEAAEVLVSQRLHREALPRAWFALFHAARGLLLREGYDARDPDTVIEVLCLRFADVGEMPPEAPAVLARGQRYQELAEYGIGWVVTPERVVAEMEVYEEHWTGLLAMLAARGVKRPASGRE